MAKEIEVKYLVSADYPSEEFTKHKLVVQWYLSTHEAHAVRVNLIIPFEYDSEGKRIYHITEAKSKINVKGLRVMETRDEFEYSIPIKDAIAMINMSNGDNIIVKVRSHNDLTNWDIDRYVDANSGLIVAEKEYSSEEELRNDETPNWCIRNVTYDDRFYNRNLATDSIKIFPEEEDLLKNIHGSLKEAEVYSHNMESYIFELDGIIQKFKD